MDDFIETYDGALGDAVCDELVAKFDASPNVGPGKTGGGVRPETKDSLDLELNAQAEFAPLLGQVYAAATARLADYIDKYRYLVLGPFGLAVPDPVTGQAVPLTGENYDRLCRPRLPELMRRLFVLGPVQAQRYERNRGGYFAWHSEVIPKPGRLDTIHRVLFVMFYLNDVAEGGETEFLYQRRKVRPRRGRMLVSPAYFTHTHRGNVPASGPKYALTSWVLFNSGERIFGGPG